MQHTEVPLVLDADALNLIAEDAEILSGCRAEKILTPHVGELARLLHMTIAECQRDPAGSAGRAAEKYQACCVRKDSVTVTAEEGREQYYINTSGSSALATAGSGDVLAGITGAFAAKRQCEKTRKNQPCQNSGTGGICAWKGGRGCGRKKQCFLCNSIRDYQRIAVNLSKADQNHGFPKGLRADFLKRRMKFVNTSGKQAILNTWKRF